VTVLLVVGIGVVLFGAYVLMVQPQTAGGKVKVLGLGEMDSATAGLPLIALGLVAIGVSATHGVVPSPPLTPGSTPPPPPSTAATPSPSPTLPSASAPPPADAPYRCDGDGTWCARVTAIAPGSDLVLHSEANFTSGTDPHYRGHDGDELVIRCWTYSSTADADGHGDHYWFQVTVDHDGGGWVNDWYVTTGSHAVWSPLIPHC
jgi:hypothetical protein